jgi:hypothetical protein
LLTHLLVKDQNIMSRLKNSRIERLDVSDKLLMLQGAKITSVGSDGTESEVSLTELTALDVTPGTATASKAVVLNASKGISTITTATITTLTTDAIAAGDASLGITGLAAAQGGAVALTGGTSSTAGNAGGAVTLTGGTPGATSAGGAVTLVGGAGGATSGAGGASSLTGGAGTAGNSAGGAVTVTGGAGQGTAAGGAASITGGASGGGATGNGGAATVAGGAAASTNGNGGSVVLTAGAKAGTGLDGLVRINGRMARKLSRATIANAATISDAEIAGGILYQDASGGAVTMTTRTGTQMAAAFPDLAVGEALSVFLASNHAANTSTIAGGVDVTLVGSGAVTNTGGQFMLVKTAATTFDLVRTG